MSKYIMVLNDGETFTNLEGCAIVEVPDLADTEAIEEQLRSGPNGGTIGICRHCDRRIVLEADIWIDPEATGDDSVWRETCDAHDTFTAEHEPDDGCVARFDVSNGSIVFSTPNGDMFDFPTEDEDPDPVTGGMSTEQIAEHNALMENDPQYRNAVHDARH